MTTNRRYGQTPSQTIGPFFAYGLTPEQYGYDFASIATSDVLGDYNTGTIIQIVGTVFDGEGAPVNDAMIEIWQADDQGRHAANMDLLLNRTPFRGFGRTGTGMDSDCRFKFRTVKPGSVKPGLAPAIDIVLFMRGQLNHLFTRLYFADEDEANAGDPILQSVPAARRKTLLAARNDTAEGIVYTFDIHMQGPDETVFFDM